MLWCPGIILLRSPLLYVSAQVNAILIHSPTTQVIRWVGDAVMWPLNFPSFLLTWFKLCTTRYFLAHYGCFSNHLAITKIPAYTLYWELTDGMALTCWIALVWSGEGFSAAAVTVTVSENLVQELSLLSGRWRLVSRIISSVTRVETTEFAVLWVSALVV